MTHPLPFDPEDAALDVPRVWTTREVAEARASTVGAAWHWLARGGGRRVGRGRWTNVEVHLDR